MFFNKVYKCVQAIPPGKVASYGQIAAMAGNPRAARIVGWALHQLKSSVEAGSGKTKWTIENVPWHRVINARGEISTTCLEHSPKQQASLLKKEGIEVKLIAQVYKIDLKKYGWY